MISTITVQNILFSIKDSRVGDDDFQVSFARRYAKLIDRRARKRKIKKERKEERKRNCWKNYRRRGKWTIILQNILFSIKDSRVGDDDFQASYACRYAKLIDKRAKRRKRKRERKKEGETVEKLTENR